MLKDIVKIFYKSDFTIQWELPEGYDGQDFRFTLFTNDDIEDGWTASYIDGTYTHCLVEDDRVTIYVDADHDMKAGCLTVQSEYDLGNNHFADGTETIKDRVKTNIYLVSIGANGTSATFIASNRADLTGSGDFVTFSDLDAMSYVTSNELSQMSYVTISDLGDYLTQEEIEDMGFLTQAQLDAMGYATTDYIDSKDYATSAQVAMKQNLLVSGRNIKTVNGYSLLGQGNITIESGSEGEYNVIEAIEVNGEPQPIDNKTVDIIVPTALSDLTNDTGFITESALGEMVTYSYLETAISDFVTSEDLVDEGYVTTTSLQSALEPYVTDEDVQQMMTNAGYITSNELSQMGYINTQYLNQASYVTQQGLSAMGYITAAQVPTPDMSAYVTKTELSNAGYVTSSDISQMGYVTSSDLSGFVTDTELSNVLSTASYVTSNELSNAGYITNSTLSQASYVTQQGLSAMSYATTSQLNAKQDTLVSGTNIKTINNESLLGSGNIDIQGGGGGSTDYSHVLKFTATQASSSVTLNRVGTDTSLANAVLQYSTDDGANWTDYTLGATITLTAVGDSVMFKGTNATLGVDTSNYHQFVMTGKISASGDITSLFNETGGDIIMPAYGCFYLFNSCSSLTKAPELPATALGIWCYTNMFLRCSSLTKAPELPATTLTDYCYASMFSSCIALKEAPELPATTLAQYCYTSMFEGCSSLTKAPELPATTLAQYCYQYMFTNCLSLTKAPELPATTLTDYCYNAMFQGCSSLTKAPELPATTLAQYCYYYMFNGCTSLTKAPELPAMTLTQGCYYYMFNRCTSLTKAPDLPATDLSPFGCYRYMFYGCTHLNYVKAMILSDMSSVSNNTFNWMNNVPVTGVFVMNNNAAWDPEQNRGANGVPTGWAVYKTISIDTDDFPESYVEDNGKGLQVVNGAWQKVSGLLTSANLIYDSTTNTLTINV